jgi:hypothetical protein
MSRIEKSRLHPDVLRITKDSTFYLPIRKGDALLFCCYRGATAKPDKAFHVADIWELMDGDRVSLTNRPCDLPRWFRLHPTEVCGELVYTMMEKLDSGYQPKEIMEGPNIWRARAGDKLIWMGDSRTGYKADLGLLKIFDFGRCALITGEPHDTDSISLTTFGNLTKNWAKTKKTIKCQNAFLKIEHLGLPRDFDPEWKLG